MFISLESSMKFILVLDKFILFYLLFVLENTHKNALSQHRHYIIYSTKKPVVRVIRIFELN